MREKEEILCALDEVGLGAWRAPLSDLLAERFGDRAHGDIGKWRAVIEQLPAMHGTSRLGDPVISVSHNQDQETPGAAQRDAIREQLLQLRPWRKGPFDIHGIQIDTEWRSDFKWDRLKDGIDALAGRRVLDVGCGNGYFALRMHGAGAQCVLGIDPTLLFVFQFLALKRFIAADTVVVVPLRLHELPEAPLRFDTTFSMGVLYHQRDPLEHLAQLRRTLRPGGQLVLETLVLPGSESLVRDPEGRYARMRNVWHLPTVPALEEWLEQAGFRQLRLIDVTPTTAAEQRRTEWMPFESLPEALDPHDPGLTVEGWPAPTRAIMLGKAP